ncbi:MAG TPA: hypothetical protein VGE74_05885 [Gemmata sp.]
MTEQLQTLQELILAARAAGDEELAAFLTDAADDPEQLAALTSGAPPSSKTLASSVDARPN